MLELYFWPTPNGKKVTILLEELGVPYTIKPVNISRGDQLSPEFLKLSPNNRMPALVDTDPSGSEGPLSLFESGAIMLYLAEKFGRFWPQEAAKKYDVVQWVMWQMGNQGPKFGEQGHFSRAAHDGKHGDLAYANRRFADEVHRLYGVMNLGLFNKRYLAAGEYTVADMICFPWASGWKQRNIDLAEFPYVKRWLEELEARPGVQKGMSIGAQLPEDQSALPEAEKARRAQLLYNQRARPIPPEWRS